MGRVDAIADPVRLAVARYLAANPSSSAQDVAAAVRVHLNTARAHLGALAEAGVVTRSAEPRGGRGRPVVRYRLREGWSPGGDELLPLSELLASALLRVGVDPDELRSLGVEWGRRWARDPALPSIEERLAAALARLGFRANMTRGRIALSACPCPLVSPAEPALLCGLADGVIDGVLEDSRLRARARRHDPKARRCSTALVEA